VLGSVEYGLELAHNAQINAELHFPALQPWVQAVLVRLYLRQGDFNRAQAALPGNYRDMLVHTHTLLTPVLVALATAELALARQDYPYAVLVIDDLSTYLVPQGMRTFTICALHIKSQALLAMGHERLASRLLHEAQTEAEDLDVRHQLWPVLFTLSQLEAQQGNQSEADSLWLRAHTVLEEIAQQLDNLTLRSTFLQTSYADAVLKKAYNHPTPFFAPTRTPPRSRYQGH
jgi:hypothetical protein